jgi:hypothetical protein
VREDAAVAQESPDDIDQAPRERDEGAGEWRTGVRHATGTPPERRIVKINSAT